MNFYILVTLEQGAAIITIGGTLVAISVFLANLRSKIHEVENIVKEMKQDYRESERRLREAEIKVHAYSLAWNIIFQQEEIKKHE